MIKPAAGSFGLSTYVGNVIPEGVPGIN